MEKTKPTLCQPHIIHARSLWQGGQNVGAPSRGWNRGAAEVEGRITQSHCSVRRVLLESLLERSKGVGFML